MAGPSAFTLADLDAFAATAVIPRAHTRLQRHFFSKRVVHDAKKHIRAFAGEVLTALQVLGLFTSAVLAPSGALPDYVVLMQLTCVVMDLLQRGDEACAHTERLALLMTRFHRQFMTVMPQCRKPKLHFMHHIPTQMRRMRKHLSCFAPERFHTVQNRWLRHVFRNMEVALVRRNADDMLTHFQNADAFQPQRLIGRQAAVHMGDIGANLIQLAGYKPEAAFKAMTAASFGGELRTGDVLTWLARGTRHLGKAVGFYALIPMAVPWGRKVAAMVEECVVRPHGWAWGCRSTLVALDKVEGAVMYLRDTEGNSDTFKVYIPHRT